jgi:hypothetical protein
VSDSLLITSKVSALYSSSIVTAASTHAAQQLSKEHAAYETPQESKFISILN